MINYSDVNSRNMEKVFVLIFALLLILPFAFAQTKYIDTIGTVNLSIGSVPLFIDETHNLIGINTTTPGQLLDIRGNVNITGVLSAGTFSPSSILTSSVNTSTLLQLQTGGTLLLPDSSVTSAMINSLDASKLTNTAFLNNAITLTASNITGDLSSFNSKLLINIANTTGDYGTVLSNKLLINIINITGDYGTTLNDKITLLAPNITGDLSSWNTKLTIAYANTTGIPPATTTLPIGNITGDYGTTLNNKIQLNAANVTAGTFASGDFVFPNYANASCLSVQENISLCRPSASVSPSVANSIVWIDKQYGANVTMEFLSAGSIWKYTGAGSANQWTFQYQPSSGTTGTQVGRHGLIGDANYATLGGDSFGSSLVWVNNDNEETEAGLCLGNISNAALCGSEPFTTNIYGTFGFEGSVIDDFDTEFAITNPTANRVITFPDLSGTIAFLSQVPNQGGVTIPASNVTAGTFPAGNFVFPDNLTVNQNITFNNQNQATNNTMERWLDTRGVVVAIRYWNGTALVLNVTGP